MASLTRSERRRAQSDDWFNECVRGRQRVHVGIKNYFAAQIAQLRAFYSEHEINVSEAELIKTCFSNEMGAIVEEERTLESALRPHFEIPIQSPKAALHRLKHFRFETPADPQASRTVMDMLSYLQIQQVKSVLLNSAGLNETEAFRQNGNLTDEAMMAVFDTTVLSLGNAIGLTQAYLLLCAFEDDTEYPPAERLTDYVLSNFASTRNRRLLAELEREHGSRWKHALRHEIAAMAQVHAGVPENWDAFRKLHTQVLKQVEDDLTPHERRILRLDPMTQAALSVWQQRPAALTIADTEARLLQQWLFAQLTPRQRDVFSMMLQGHTDREIATRLQMHIGSVKQHKARIRRKLSPLIGPT